jgi:hypothetical protein
MTRRKDVPPEALEASRVAAEEEGRRRVAEAVATLLESRYCPDELSDLVADHVIKISEATELYIFAPEVVRATYPLMCERAAQLERERKQTRPRRTRKASAAKGEPPPAETDAVN